MAGFSGRAVVITIDGVTIEDELRSKTITHPGTLVDGAAAADGGVRVTVDGIEDNRHLSIAVEGIVKTDKLLALIDSKAKFDAVITVGTLCTYTGTFQFDTGGQISAAMEGELTFSGTILSDGAYVRAVL